MLQDGHTSVQGLQSTKVEVANLEHKNRRPSNVVIIFLLLAICNKTSQKKSMKSCVLRLGLLDLVTRKFQRSWSQIGENLIHYHFI